VREFLTEVIQTPGGKVDEQSRLCQSYKNTAEVLAAAFFLRKNDVPHPGPQRCLFVWACRLVTAGEGFNNGFFRVNHLRLFSAGFSIDFNASERAAVDKDFRRLALA
jgi:hypothetical protein